MKKQNLVEMVVGTFVLIGLGAVFIMVMSIANEQNLFVKMYRLNATFRNVSGLKAGAPVFLSGVEAGTVESLSFTSGGWVQVTLLLRDDYGQRIKEDSIATIGSVGLLGDKCVHISMGSFQADVLEPSDSLQTEVQLSIAELIDGFDSVRDRLEEVLDNMSEITGALVEDRVALKRGLEGAADLLENLTSGQGSLGKLMKDETLYDSLVTTVQDGGRTARALEEAARKAVPLVEELGVTARNVRSSSERYPEIAESASRLLESSTQAMEKLNSLAADFKGVSEKLPAVVDSVQRSADNIEKASRELPDSARNIRKTTDEAGRVVEAAKSNWLLKGAFPEDEDHAPVEVNGR
jgi:phospholipid/cholesterol/gamma-HCH transport system substrate-binding protein